MPHAWGPARGMGHGVPKVCGTPCPMPPTGPHGPCLLGPDKPNVVSAVAATTHPTQAGRFFGDEYVGPVGSCSSAAAHEAALEADVAAARARSFEVCKGTRVACC